MVIFHAIFRYGSLIFRLTAPRKACGVLNLFHPHTRTEVVVRTLRWQPPQIDRSLLRHAMSLGVGKLWQSRSRVPVLAVSAVGILAIAAVDLWTKPYFALEFLYLFPLLLAAAHLRRWQTVVLALVCAALGQAFGLDDRSLVRVSFVALALSGSGLFAAELVQSRRQHMQQEARLTALVETSPAAIVMVDEHGLIDLANRAAVDLMASKGGHLIGAPIAAFLPGLHNALQGGGPQFRSSMRCLAHKATAEVFTADVWFSTYKDLEGPAFRLAAIVADVTEEESVAAAGAVAGAMNSELSWLRGGAAFNSREADALRLVVRGLSNKEIAAQTGTSESAVKHTLQQLFTKTGVRTRSQLVRVALEQHRNLL